MNNVPIAQSKARISLKLKTAIGLMIYEGLNRAQAAQAVGMADNSLYVALRRPEVLRYKNDVLRAFRESEAERSFTRTVELRDKAASEHVALAAAKTIMAMDDRFIEKTYVHQHHSGRVEHSPGYMIDLTPEPEEPAQVIVHQVQDVTPIEES